MKRFYEDYDSIHLFTLSLDYHRNGVACVHCLKNDQFVAHGIIRKQRSISQSEKVGKRIFCSNRYGRTGCGRTFQLYVANEIPSFRYGAAQLFIFITALLANLTIVESYQVATGQSETRNAWRWLNRLILKLCDYRSFLKVRVETGLYRCTVTLKRLRHLLPTLARLFTPINNGCFDYQINQQQRFL